MGLHVHSLAEIPLGTERDYYVYLLDYGWAEPLGGALRENFGRIAEIASKHRAAALIGTVGSHFEDEVLSWHRVNGQPARDILPAVLITTRHPHDFRVAPPGAEGVSNPREFPLLLLKLKEICKTPTDVTDVLERIFSDIKHGKPLSDFEVAEEHSAGKGFALVDALILRPSIGGVGVDLKKLTSLFAGSEARDEE